MMRLDVSAEVSLKRAPQACTLAVIAISLLAAIGWLGDIPVLRQVNPAFVPIVPSAILMFLLLASATFAYARWPAHHAWRNFAWVNTAAVFCTAAALLVTRLLKGSAGLENLRFTSPFTWDKVTVSMLSPITAFLFLLAAGALACLLANRQGKSRWNTLASCLALIVLIAAVLFSGAYLTQHPLLYQGAIIPPAFPAVLNFVLLGSAQILLAGRHAWPARHFTGNSSRALLLRTFLPFILALILLENSVELSQIGGIHHTLTAAAETLLFTLAAVGFVIVISRSLGRTLDKVNQALSESEEKYRRVVENSQQGITIFRLDRILFVNAAAAQILGYTQAEMLALSPTDIKAVIHPEDQAWVLEMSQKRISGILAPSQYECRLVHKSGKTIWVSANSQQIEFNGQPAIQTSYADISEQKQSNERLEQERNRAQQYLQVTGAIILALDATGQVTLINQRGCQVLGRQQGDILGKNWFECFAPERLRANTQDNFAQIIAGKLTLQEFYELPVLNSSGKERMVQWHMVLTYDDNGKITGSLSSGEDITELRQLQVEQQRFFDLSVELLCIAEIDGSFKHVNAAWTNALGWSAQELTTRPWIEFVHPDDRGNTEQARVELRHGCPIYHFENRYRTKDGQYRWLNWNSLAVPEDGLIYAVAHDITERRQVEESLRLSEAHFRAMIEQSPMALQICHPDGSLAYANPTTIAIFNIPADWLPDLLGSYNILQDPQLLDQGLLPYLQAGFAGKTITTPIFSYRSVSRASQPPVEKTFWVKDYLYALLDEQGAVQDVVVLTEDLTELIEAQKARQTSEERFQLFMDHLPAAAFIKDGDSRTLFINRYLDEILGGAHWLGKTTRELFPSPVGEQMCAADQHALQKGYEKITEVVPHADGSLHTYETQKFALQRPGLPPLLGGISINISERRQAEEALRQYAGRLETLSEIDHAILQASSPAQIARAAIRHLHQLISCQQIRICEFPPDDQHAVLLASDTPNHFNQSIPLSWFGDLDALRRGEMVDTHPGNEARTLHIPMLVEGQLIGCLSLTNRPDDPIGEPLLEIARQVADRVAIALLQSRLREHIRRHNEELEQRVAQRTAQLEQANKELEAFSYSVSHDLRAPLRSLGGFSHILLSEYGELSVSEIQHYLKHIHDSALQMGALIDDLLNFSRLSRQPLNRQRVEPLDIVQEVWRQLAFDQEAERQIELALGNLPACQADPNLLKQVFTNLIANALKYTRLRQPARIEIGCRKIENELAYYVSDNGVGFEMQYAHKLFGVFQRLHRAEDYEGTGVGLAIVQRIIQRHGGRVWAKGEVDRGATFYFTLGD